MIEAHPLSWPAGWPRTARPERSRFEVTFTDARRGVIYEIERLGGRDIVISSNLPLRKDGLPYANTREPDDPGVAVYFILDGQQRCFPVDKWDRVRDNLRAIEKSVEALRGLDRWGSKHMIDAAFAGFAALPAGGAQDPDAWWTVLEVESDATLGEIREAYRRLVRLHHPDVGGYPPRFLRIQEAYQQAKEAVQS